MKEHILKTLYGQYDSVIDGCVPFFLSIDKKYGKNESYIIGALLSKLNEFLSSNQNYEEFNGVTSEELENLLNLSPYSRRIAIKILKSAGLIEEKRIDRIAHYTANIRNIYKLVYGEEK